MKVLRMEEIKALLCQERRGRRWLHLVPRRQLQDLAAQLDDAAGLAIDAGDWAARGVIAQVLDLVDEELFPD